MSRESARAAMQAFRESGGIDASQSASDVQSSVAADIARIEGGTNAGQLDTVQATQGTTQGASDQGSGTQDTGQATGAQGAIDTAREAARNTLDTSSQIAGRISDRISAQPTPGGIAAALIVLFILVFILIPVDVSKQYSRVQLLIMSLLGHTRLIGRRVIGNTTNPGTGGTTVPITGSEGDPSPNTGFYIEPLYNEPVDVDAQSQYTDTMVVEETSYEELGDSDSDYWETIDSINHDGL